MAMTTMIQKLAKKDKHLLLWFEKMEFVFHISNCTVACQIKFATCTLQRNALTWWNSHVKTVTHEVEYAMTWKTLKKMMTDKYCPRGENKKLEIKMWNLKVKAYFARPNKKKEYVRTLPLCNKCKLHHNGLCTVKYANCQKAGHLTRDCRSPTTGSNQRTLTCYKYGNQGHYRSDCPELKNRNHGNQTGGTEARGIVYALGGGETN
ncbi:reverse transcriptase domain-containing protein [Tanacetum coccineum]